MYTHQNIRTQKEMVVEYANQCGCAVALGLSLRTYFGLLTHSQLLGTTYSNIIWLNGQISNEPLH